MTFRRRRGFAIVGPDGEYAFTTPHPVSGRPIAALRSDAREALRIAADIARG